MKKELSVCLKAAQAGAKIIHQYYGKSFGIRHKGAINIVTDVDEKAQKAILKIIRASFPKDAILAEEGDLSLTAEAPRRWIIDPLDGTTNFAHGYPRFCVSIAFEQEGDLKVGVIIDPLLKETFYAVRGKGAFLNKKKMRVSKILKLKEALLVTGFPYDLENPEFDNLPLFAHLIKRAQAIRRDGSAALNLAYVAAGRFDGFWELGLSPWDIAAGMLMIEEAGGIVKHLSGKNVKVDDHSMIGCNPFIYEEFVGAAAEIWPGNRSYHSLG